MTEKILGETAMTEKILAWHFLPNNGALANGDGRKPVVGETLVHEGTIELCNSGFHASKHAIDALRYAPGALVCRVEVGGSIIQGDDKLVASERTILWQADATNTLHEFACQCAEDALHQIPESNRGVFESAIAAKRSWLRGEVTDDELAAARDAVWSVSWAAAWDAAWDAAWAAAWAASWATGRSASWAAQNTRLEHMLMKLSPTGNGNERP